MDNKRLKTILATTAALLLMRQKRKETKKRRRRYSVRPLNLNRDQLGVYKNLFTFTKNRDVEQFQKYVRMTPEQFDCLLGMVSANLTKRNTIHTLNAEQRLALTLHYLAEGCSMQEMAWNYYVGKSTVHCVVKETCRILWDILQPVYLPSSTAEHFAEISNGFLDKWQMPNCIGAIDGKHVVIQAPKHAGSEYFSYKKTHSIILLASCDAFYKFSMIDVGQPGSNHDGHVFRESSFGKRLLNGSLNIPAEKELPGTHIKIPHFLVADQAFPLHRNIMRPYPGANLQERQNIFNYRLSRARRTIENTFGILSQRWRILRKPIIANIEICESIIKAVVVLHNYIQKKEEDLPENKRLYVPCGYVDQETMNGQIIPGEWRNENVLRSVGRLGSNNSSQHVRLNRDIVAGYFESPLGNVPGQLNYVQRGTIHN